MDGIERNNYAFPAEAERLVTHDEMLCCSPSSLSARLAELRRRDLRGIDHAGA